MRGPLGGVLLGDLEESFLAGKSAHAQKFILTKLVLQAIQFYHAANDIDGPAMRVVVICVGSGRVHRELCDRSRHTCCVAADKN